MSFSRLCGLAGDRSVTARVEHVKAQGRASDLKAAEHGTVAGSNASACLEESIWLCPIENRRELDSSREGMLEGFSLGSYLLLIDYTGRLFRDGKAVISAELAGILERLGTSAEAWRERLQKLRDGRLLGRFFAASRRACEKPRPTWACTTWQTWAVAGHDKAIAETTTSSNATSLRVCPQRPPTLISLENRVRFATDLTFVSCTPSDWPIVLPMRPPLDRFSGSTSWSLESSRDRDACPIDFFFACLRWPRKASITACLVASPFFSVLRFSVFPLPFFDPLRQVRRECINVVRASLEGLDRARIVVDGDEQGVDRARHWRRS